MDLVVYDKAGERIVEDLLHQAEKRLREDGISGNILLFKNNTDSAGNSYGCHENYLVSRDVSFQRLAEALIPFFVTRQIFAGAGKVLQTPRGFHYCLSQRAQHICQEISGATTSSRSIINTRDEPHADAEKYRRLHVIVGDSNMSEVATYLKVGTTAVVLDMIEDGYFDRDYSLPVPGPGHPGHLPRPYPAGDGEAQGRPRDDRAGDPEGVPGGLPRCTRSMSTRTRSPATSSTAGRRCSPGSRRTPTSATARSTGSSSVR